MQQPRAEYIIMFYTGIYYIQILNYILFSNMENILKIAVWRY